ncbi:hypothetical protein OKW47_004836 [Paraburkholderia atlantica]
MQCVPKGLCETPFTNCLGDIDPAKLGFEGSLPMRTRVG